MGKNFDITIGERSDKSGQFNFVRGPDGDVQFDETCAHGVVTSATEEKASYAEDPEHGIDRTPLRNLKESTPSAAVAVTLDSLATLELEGEIVDVNVTAEAEKILGQRTGRLARNIRWSTPSGRGGEKVV